MAASASDIYSLQSSSSSSNTTFFRSSRYCSNSRMLSPKLILFLIQFHQENLLEENFDDEKPLEFDMLRSVTKAHFAANPLIVTKNTPLRVPLIG